MDADRFDRLARAVWSATHTRRAGLGALSAAVLGRLGLGRASGQRGCKDVGSRCGAGSECCTRLCIGRCVCRRVGERCSENFHCCGSICQGGVCRCRADDHCGPESFCCDDGLCDGCCDDGDCGGTERCCRDPQEGNRCVTDSECGRDADCGIGNRCEDCRLCVCDPAKCGASDLQGCCPPRRVEYCQFSDGSAEVGGKIYCGKPGETCQFCDKAAGQKCHPTQRRCVCDAAKCKQRNGCCHPKRKTCEAGTTETACGKAGKTCQVCSKKGAGWICRNQRCCVKDGETCPAACPANGPCSQCCDGRCTGGKCGNLCGNLQCAPDAPCCGVSQKKCCEVGQYCCGETQCITPSVDHCGECGTRCNNSFQPPVADACVDGKCKCGNGPPCDCTTGAICENGRCVCRADPGWKLCSANDEPCTFYQEFIGAPCTPGATEACECPEEVANANGGRCPMPS